MKSALITGVTGQDGSYLAEFLLHKGYEVHGLIRRASTFNTSRIDHLISTDNSHFKLHHADLTDSSRLTTLIGSIRPNEVYHLGAQSHVRVSFDEPENTGNVSGLGTTRLLEAIRIASSESKFYQASSSEMFGASAPPQFEKTPFHPRSPYACSKVFSYWTARNYREAYGIFASNGILFNHESIRRGETFVTRKISRAVARIKAGLQSKLSLGNLEARRDWGHAPDYVEAMWLIMQQPEADDFVVATGTSHSVDEFLEASFSEAGLDSRKYVEIDPRFFRPSEVDSLIGNASKIEKATGWRPETSGLDLAGRMVRQDIQLLRDPGYRDQVHWRV